MVSQNILFMSLALFSQNILCESISRWSVVDGYLKVTTDDGVFPSKQTNSWSNAFLSGSFDTGIVTAKFVVSKSEANAEMALGVIATAKIVHNALNINDPLVTHVNVPSALYRTKNGAVWSNTQYLGTVLPLTEGLVDITMDFTQTAHPKLSLYLNGVYQNIDVSLNSNTPYTFGVSFMCFKQNSNASIHASDVIVSTTTPTSTDIPSSSSPSWLNPTTPIPADTKSFKNMTSTTTTAGLMQKTSVISSVTIAVLIVIGISLCVMGICVYLQRRKMVVLRQPLLVDDGENGEMPYNEYEEEGAANNDFDLRGTNAALDNYENVNDGINNIQNNDHDVDNVTPLIN